MPMSLDGKSAIVTGASRGINLAYAKKLLEAGTNVLIADLDLTPEATELMEKYNDKPKAVFQKTDVTSWPDLDAMFKKAQESFGPVDIVCPGAGIFEPTWSNFWYPPGSKESRDDPASGRYKQLDVNITHPIRTAQMAISHFLAGSPRSAQSDPKRIVFIASVGGEIAILTTPLYHATKFAIMGFLRSLSELDQHFAIRSVGVAPAAVKTRLWFEEEAKARIVTDKETGKIQESWVFPEEVADVMLALSRDDEIDDGKGGKIPIQGGTVIEVCHQIVRDVPMLGNAGPDFNAPGLLLANMEGAYSEIIEALQQPGWGQF